MALSRTIFITGLFLSLFSISSYLLGGVGGILMLTLAVFVFPNHGSIFLSSTLIFQRLLVLEIGQNSLWFIITFIYVILIISKSALKVSKKYFYLLIFSIALYTVNLQFIFFLAILKILVLYTFIKYTKTNEFLISYFISVLFFVMFGYFSPNVDFWNHGGRLSLEPLTNPNIFAIDLVLLLLVLWSKKAIPLVYFGFLTKSRTFLVGLLLLVVKNYKRKAILFAPIAVGILFNLFPELFDRILNPRQGDITGDRAMIWIYYLDYIMRDPSTILFGGSIMDIASQSPFKQVPHNLILEGVLNYGLIGLSLLFIHLKVLARLSIQSFVVIVWIPIAVFMTSHDLFNLSFITLYFLYVKQSKEFGLVS